MVIKKLQDEIIENANVTEFALSYDGVKHHTWYGNLDYLIDISKEMFNNDSFIMDYSCGTGIFSEKLNLYNCNPNIVMMDTSLKYLRLAYEKFKNNSKYSFRLLDLKKGIEESLVDNLDDKLDGIICSNAIHLYPTIDETIKSWNRLLKKGGKLLINSGNIDNPKMKTPTSVLIDQTVNEIFNLSIEIVRGNKTYAQYWNKISDIDYFKKYIELKDKYFLPIRDIEYYTNSLYENGFVIKEVKSIDVEATAKEWFDFLNVYDEGILGWIGGVKKISGEDANLTDIQNRLDIMEEALNRIFNNQKDFNASWNYIICEKV
jgi:ubiquinone/menaquinone biosynthesis C-methylase UbiE